MQVNTTFSVKEWQDEKPSWLEVCPLGRWKYASASLLFHGLVLAMGLLGFSQKQAAMQPMSFMTVQLIARSASAEAPPAKAEHQLAQLTPDAGETVEKPVQTQKAEPVVVPRSVIFPRQEIVHKPETLAHKPVTHKSVAKAETKTSPSLKPVQQAEAKPAAHPDTGTTQDNGHQDATVQKISTGTFITPPPVNYPRRAQQLGKEGTVSTRLYVDARGAIQKTELARSSGFAMLDNEVMAKLRLAKLPPLMRNGVPAPGWVAWDYRFVLF